MTPILPTEILEEIVFKACDLNVTEALKSHITRYAYRKAYPKKILIHGDIQSGKTSEIIKILKNDLFKSELKVLVIQNSTMVLKQYTARLRMEGISFQVVDVNTKKITSNVVILLNNVYRYSYFFNLCNRNSNVDVLILDESDQTVMGCPLKATTEYHVTATPIYPRKLKMHFDHVIKLQSPENYYGLNDLTVVCQDDTLESVNSFLKTNSGMMLINKYMYIEEMKVIGQMLTDRFPQIPIVILNSEKKLLIDGSCKKVTGSISKIIDSLDRHPHIIFIANRLSLRGLSYVSSDRTRHLTHQITRIRYDFRNFMQSLRICGVYPGLSTQLKLIISTDEQQLFEKFKGKYENLRNSI